jgi:hypothetical protein
MERGGKGVRRAEKEQSLENPPAGKNYSYCHSPGWNRHGNVDVIREDEVNKALGLTADQ